MMRGVEDPSPREQLARSFGNPPVVETILSAQFEPLPGFSNAHLGLFWEHVGGRQNWPTASDDAPLNQEFEYFGDALEWVPLNEIRFGIAKVPVARMRLWNAAKDRMLQVQNGRFVYNWLGTGNSYPRYDTIKPEFDNVLGQFREFLSKQDLPPVSPNQWEITYINHLPKNTVWENVTDWSQVLTFHAVPPIRVGECKLETFGGHWSYEIAPNRGRLHMYLQHAKNEQRAEILILNLTARGPIREGEGTAADLDSGLNLGHDVIVGAFSQLTSEKAQAHWGKERPQ